MHRQQIKLNAGSLRGRKKFAITPRPETGAAPLDSRLAMQKLHRLKEERRFLFQRDRKRVHAKRRDDRVCLHRFRREQDGLAHQRR